MVFLAVAITGISAVTTQLRCVDAARATALAAARGEPEARTIGGRNAPAGAEIVVEEGELIRVTVRASVNPFAQWIPGPTVTATAVAEPEPGEVQ